MQKGFFLYFLLVLTVHSVVLSLALQSLRTSNISGEQEGIVVPGPILGQGILS